MKKQIREFSDVKILKRNTKLQAGCLYLLSSESTAQSMYFESKRDISFAHRQIKRHLSGVMNIVDYLFTPFGWAIVVEVKSEEEILEYCEGIKKLSETLKSAILIRNVSVILSEFVRYTISSIAGFVNRHCQRSGAVVKENFSRYVFENIATAQEVMLSMKKNELNLCRQRKRYVPKLHLWDTKRELIGMGNVFLTTRKMIGGFVGRGYRGVVIDFVLMKNDVLQQLIYITINHHFPTKKPKKPPHLPFSSPPNP